MFWQKSFLLSIFLISQITSFGQIPPALQFNATGTDARTSVTTGVDGSCAISYGPSNGVGPDRLNWFNSGGNLIYDESAQLLSPRFVSNDILISGRYYGTPYKSEFRFHLRNGTNGVSTHVIGRGNLDVKYLPNSRDYQVSFYSESGNIQLFRISKILGSPSITNEMSLPIDVVVLPAENMGNINVQLQKSKDLVLWEVESPGIYNSENLATFYRIQVGTSKSIPVVVPASNNSSALVIFETSEDLVNWQIATNGTYGSSVKKFFRLRVIFQ